MDAVEYLKDRTRMTKEGKHNPHHDICGISCNECPLYERNSGLEVDCQKIESFYPEKAVEIVEKWAAEHPKKTRQSEFLKMFPRVRTSDDGVIYMDPCDVDTSYENENGCGNITCRDCKEKYWLAEVDND